MNCLHLVTHGGIANRIRALVSAMWMAERTGVELVVSWRHDKYVPASWEDLYEGTLPAPPAGLDARDTLRLEDETFIDLARPELSAADVIELYTCQAFSFRPEIPALTYRFWAAVRPHLLRLVPGAAASEIADTVADRFGPDVLGAHLRIGAGGIDFNTPSRATLEMFFAEIDRVREEAPGTQVYLASDSADTVVEARKRYGTALIAMDDHIRRNFRTTETIEDMHVALAEIILLSRTRRLLGTYFSSFAPLAGAMGALPYKELGRPDKKPRWRRFRSTPDEPDD